MMQSFRIHILKNWFGLQILEELPQMGPFGMQALDVSP